MVGDEPSQEVARAVFGPEYGRVRRYAELLATEGVRRGLMGPREVSRLWSRHLVNCAMVAPVIPSSDQISGAARVCDVGSGAGLPGIVVALVRPDVELVLLEPLLRRWSFLREVLAELDLEDHVEARRERAEEHGGRHHVVLARAVAPLARLAEWTLPLCQPGGVLLAFKGRRAEEELDGAVDTLRRLGASSWSIEEYGAGLVDPVTTVVRVTVGGFAGAA